MTTAHRPTWHQALGGEGQGGNKLVSSGKVASRDLPSHKALKTRLDSRPEDARRTLEEKELAHKHKQAKLASVDSLTRNFDGNAAIEDDHDRNPFPEDADDDGPTLGGYASSEDESDEEEELRKELELIKQERQEDERKKAEKTAAEQTEVDREKVLRGNPLLSSDTYVGINRRWDDDVVFKNQTKGKAKPKKTFINDAVRSEFHKKFLTKYIC
eukprot:GHVQ01008575.1.p1 GENE.GHVQ01008575.1~~GHVQ01008575.1.p1  ORF type:complete len:214 (-),score=46.54 GHVQ01008575.1:172-813(-)